MEPGHCQRVRTDFARTLFGELFVGDLVRITIVPDIFQFSRRELPRSPFGDYRKRAQIGHAA
jgi:hypothetical protein